MFDDIIAMSQGQQPGMPMQPQDPFGSKMMPQDPFGGKAGQQPPMQMGMQPQGMGRMGPMNPMQY